MSYFQHTLLWEIGSYVKIDQIQLLKQGIEKDWGPSSCHEKAVWRWRRKFGRGWKTIEKKRAYLNICKVRWDLSGKRVALKRHLPYSHPKPYIATAKPDAKSCCIFAIPLFIDIISFLLLIKSFFQFEKSKIYIYILSFIYIYNSNFLYIYKDYYINILVYKTSN